MKINVAFIDLANMKVFKKAITETGYHYLPNKEGTKFDKDPVTRVLNFWPEKENRHEIMDDKIYESVCIMEFFNGVSWEKRLGLTLVGGLKSYNNLHNCKKYRMFIEVKEKEKDE